MFQQTRSTRRLSQAVLLATGVVLLSAGSCDGITDAACPNQPITVNVNAVHLTDPGSPSASVSSMTVTRSSGTLPSIVNVRSVTIEQANISFSRIGTGEPGSGSVRVALVVGGYVASIGTVTVSNGSVTGYSPTTVSVGDYPRADAMAIINALPAAERSALGLQDVSGLSNAQIADAVSAAVRSASFPVAVITLDSGDLNGSLRVTRAVLNVGC